MSAIFFENPLKAINLIIVFIELTFSYFTIIVKFFSIVSIQARIFNYTIHPSSCWDLLVCANEICHAFIIIVKLHDSTVYTVILILHWISSTVLFILPPRRPTMLFTFSECSYTSRPLILINANAVRDSINPLTFNSIFKAINYELILLKLTLSIILDWGKLRSIKVRKMRVVRDRSRLSRMRLRTMRRLLKFLNHLFQGLNFGFFDLVLLDLEFLLLEVFD